MSDDKGCLHLHAFVRPSDSIGYAHCPTCDSLIRLDIVFNNFLDALRESLGVPT